MSKAQVSMLQDDICFDDITGFVTCRYDSQWWLGCVLDTSADTEEITISFLHPWSPALSFVYSRNPDLLVTHCTSVLTKVDPTTTTGQTYQLGATQHVTATRSTVVHTMWLNWLTLLLITSLRMSLKTGIFKHCKYAHLWVIICILVLCPPNTSVTVTIWCNKFASICYISIGLFFSHLHMLKHEP